MGVLLLASWLVAGYLLNKIIKENHTLKKDLHTAKKQQNSQTVPPTVTNTVTISNSDDAFDLDDEDYALNDISIDNSDDAAKTLRIQTLEHTEKNLRKENSSLRKTGMVIAEKLESRNKQINRLKTDNTKLRKSIASLSNASQEQLALIKKLHDKIERAQKLEEHQQLLIHQLEQRLKGEKGKENNEEKIKEMEAELKKLKDTLKRTLIEKEFIEEHMLELDDSLEKSKEVEAALERAQEEIAKLEDNFPDFEPEENDGESSNHTETEVVPPRPAFTTDIPEVQNIMENYRLFGALQEFWMTMDVPPLHLIEKQPIDIPDISQWVYLDIGDDDYSLLLTINEELCDLLAKAIFSLNENSSEQEQKDASGELGNIIGGTLATELDNNFAVSIPQHIPKDQAITLLSDNAVVTEILVVAKQLPIYAALITDQQPSTQVEQP